MKDILLAALGIAFGLLIMALLTSCAHRAHVEPPTVHSRLERGYVWKQEADGSYTIVATNRRALDAAKAEIKCGVCSEQKIADVYVLGSPSK